MSSTTTRLLSLLSLLQARRDWPGPVLAERLEISPRTIRRDIDHLREMGYRIRGTLGPDGGYRLEAGSELPPLLFDDEQAVAVAVALQSAPVVGASIGEAAERALASIRQVMPSRLRHRLDTIAVTPIAQRPGDPAPIDVSADLLADLASTIRARQVLRFDYTVPGAPAHEPARPPRRVEPHHLVGALGRWYLVAWDLDRDDWRIFRVDRVVPRVPHGPRFAPREVPGGDVAAFVSARFRGSDVDEWPCRGSVILHLPLSDVLPFAGDGTVRALDDDRCILDAGSWSWTALAAALGRFDAPIDVIEPPELTEAFARLADRFARTSRGEALAD